MKKTTLITLATLLLALPTFSQEAEETDLNSQNFNELKLNGLFLILGAFEVTYERTLNEESGIGVSVFLPIDKEISDDIQYFISPYYRFYFGNKYAAGFFVEGFGMLNSTNRNINVLGGSLGDDDDFRTDLALGFAVGGKWVTKKGFSIELYSGIGRNLFNNNDTDYEIIGKGGINFGYRF
jgi:hypothetical protein